MVDLEYPKEVMCYSPSIAIFQFLSMKMLLKYIFKFCHLNKRKANSNTSRLFTKLKSIRVFMLWRLPYLIKSIIKWTT